jgi:hypothetical protein
MKSAKILLLIYVLFFFSCQEKVKETDISLSKSSTLTEISNQAEIMSDNFCKCFEGIGSSKSDSPIYTFKFQNGKTISVCGFLDKEMEGFTISEFNVFDCKTGESYVEYGALEICRLVEMKNSIVISELKYLPSGNDWSWELLKIAEREIKTKADSIVVTSRIPKFEKINVDAKVRDAFLNSLTSKINNDWELEIGKLELLALNNDSDAWEYLKKYKNLKDGIVDGAHSEILNDAIENVKWIRKK